MTADPLDALLQLEKIFSDEPFSVENLPIQDENLPTEIENPNTSFLDSLIDEDEIQAILNDVGDSASNLQVDENTDDEEDDVDNSKEHIMNEDEEDDNKDADNKSDEVSSVGDSSVPGKERASKIKAKSIIEKEELEVS